MCWMSTPVSPSMESSREILKLAIQTLQKTVDVPISIDSSMVEALEAGLSVYEGKAMVQFCYLRR